MFDKKEEYQKYVEPYLKRAREACSAFGIPFFSSCCVSDDGKTSEYKNLINGSVSNGIELTDDQFSKHINVANGFDTFLNDRYTDSDKIPEMKSIP